MTHRTQIYFFLCQIWYKVRQVLQTIVQKMRVGCDRVSEFGFVRRIGEGFAGVRGTLGRFWRRIRGGRGGGAVDDDGSTMRQGLLMRENA
jgi:hypothetical protein